MPIIKVFGLFIWSADFSGFPLTSFLRELQPTKTQRSA